jgi:hypothetical protein
LVVRKEVALLGATARRIWRRSTLVPDVEPDPEDRL